FWIRESLDERQSAGLLRELKVRPVAPGRDFASNDYLGLRHSSQTHQAGLAAAQRYGSGSGSSPAVGGWSPAHEALAKTIADWKNAPAALLFTSGYLANQSAVAALVGPGDGVYLDRLSHACLVDGARLSGASVRVFPHNNNAKLGQVLQRDTGRFRRRLIVTESIYSMDGDIAPLAELATLASRHKAMLLVDEAHATGLFGPQGQGMVEELGLAGHPNLVRTGTLSKALGAQGGFVVGSKELIDWLVQAARGWIYATAISPFLAGVAIEAINQVKSDAGGRLSLRQNTLLLRERLAEQGWPVPEVAGPILPLVIADSELTTRFGHELYKKGYAVGAIRPPTVPRGTARLRLSLSAIHSQEDIDALAVAIASVASDLNLLKSGE
ncbi:MAG: aminotransferase class I/II-fold pyridoxal phosphate-dependent enzyme, partial [bacterium]